MNELSNILDKIKADGIPTFFQLDKDSKERGYILRMLAMDCNESEQEILIQGLKAELDSYSMSNGYITEQIKKAQLITDFKDFVVEYFNLIHPIKQILTLEKEVKEKTEQAAKTNQDVFLGCTMASDGNMQLHYVRPDGSGYSFYDKD